MSDFLPAVPSIVCLRIFEEFELSSIPVAFVSQADQSLTLSTACKSFTMADRNSLIKFGPEWLRNLSREGSATQSTASGSTPPNTAPGNVAGAAANTPPKVHLAKLRYGREELLALYDRDVEPPAELKNFEALYNPRGKAPLALHNTFEEEMRDSMRSGGSSMGGMGSGERMGRGSVHQSDGRGRGRSSFTRLHSSGRGGHRWQGNTNWRRHVGREEGEEWRSQQDPNKPRPNPQEKWERDWNERGDRGHSSRDKSQSWNTNRRTWGGHNDDNLPEWAVENSEACGGTFDSSGAFHGYSNDDTNLPKPPVPNPVYPLTRSHTQGSLTRDKVDEEGSDEWWASEKAKKLSPKRFDASEIKFKNQSSAPEGSQASGSKEETQSKFPDSPDSEPNDSKSDDKLGKQVQFKRSLVESKTFDGAKRSDVNLDDANDERGNFKSVIIAPNNMLRQRHQNIVSSSNEVTRPPTQSVKSTQSGKNVTTTASSAGAAASAASAKESNNNKQKGSQEEKLVNNMQKFSLKVRDSGPQKLQENTLGNDKMGYTFVEQDLADIPLPPAPKPAKPGLNISLTANSGSMANMKSAGIHQPNMSTEVASGISAAPYQSTTSYQATGKQAGSLASALYGNVGLANSGLGQGMGHVGNSGHGNNTHSGLGNMGHGGLGSAGLGSTPLAGLGNAGLGNSAQSGLNNQMHSALNNPVHPALGNSQHTSLGSSGHSGLGNVGLGNSGHPGLGNAGLRNPTHGGLRNSPHAGHGTSPHTGLGHSPHSGLGISPHVGLASSQHVGLANAALGNSAHGVLGNSAHTGLGNTGLGLQFGSAGNSLGLASPGLSGPTAAPGASLSFTNSGSNNTSKNSLFISQNNTNIGVSQTNDMNSPQPKSASASIFQLHDMPQQAPQGGFGSSIYGGVLPPPSQQPSSQTDMWYYEDPTKNIQGPFSSKEMYHWYRAGFFTSSLMVRRACDSQMQPLGSLGPVAPFAMVMNPMNLNEPGLDNMQFGNVGNNFIRSTSFSQQPMDNLWSQTASSTSDLWMQPSMAQSRSDSHATNLNLFFWEQQPSVIASNSLLPKEITKEMKTEDQILAQIRSSQNIANNRTVPFLKQETRGLSVTNVLSKPEEPKLGATPDLGELEKLIQKETLSAITPQGDASLDNLSNFLSIHDKKSVNEESNLISLQNKTVVQQQTKNKSEGEKVIVKKDTTSTKKKKTKDEKKDESTDLKKEEDCFKNEKANEIAVYNSKKDDKASKRDMEKEKKEWLKDGFTIVKGPEKNAYKDKKKIDEYKAMEEADRKRKEEEKLAAEKDIKKVEILKRPGPVGTIGAPGQGRHPTAEGGAIRKAPWSAVSAQNLQAPSKESITLAEIQRLEREKKLEMMKEQQQQMMIMLSQQHHAQLAREQELAQNVIGWAKKKGTNTTLPTNLSLAEIQAETRKQSAAAAAAAAAEAAEQAVHQALDQGMPPPLSLPPWKATPNAVSGFWETERAKKVKQSAVTEKPQEFKPAEPKTKKKPTNQASAATSGNAGANAGSSSNAGFSAGACANANASAINSTASDASASKPAKKELTPWNEFEAWCNNNLSAWATKIDVPTFVGFLKDIESPYEVKDYVKCYLGETKDSNDFARQFLERRSKLLRASTVTPVDDLCSPAAAINPRGGLDFTEGKSKKPKKNKMLKVDARILGFSVTAAEDRINVGDIDTA